MKTVTVHNVTDTARIGIVEAVEWWGHLADAPRFLYHGGYVLASWFAYSNGEDEKLEGKTTIACAVKLEDIELLFNHYKDNNK